MKSVDREVFVALRNQARSRARQGARLWKDYKRRRRARTAGGFGLPVWLVSLLWPLLAVLYFPGLVRRVGPDSFLAMLALYCSGTAFARAASLRNRLYGSTDLLVAVHYPVADREFFRWQVRQWLISCVPVFLLSTASYLCAAIYGGGVTALVPSALFGGLAQTIVVITLCLLQELWFTRIWTQIALAFYALIAAIVAFPAQLASLGGQALAFLPATWVNLWLASSDIGTLEVIFALVSIGLLAALDARLVWSIEKGYPRTDVTLVLQQDFHEEAGEAAVTVAADQRIESDFDWQAGHWTTRAAGRWLTPRQRLVVEFLAANEIDAWKGRVRLAVQLTAAGAFLCLMPFAVPIWLSLGAFIMAAIAGGPVLGGSWPGLRPGWFGFAQLQPVAGYPIGYVEASLSIMKVNAVRLVGFAPMALIAGLLIGWRYFQPTTGLLISAQFVLLSLAMQPYCALFLHSAGTNDTKRLNRTSFLFACALIANAVMVVPVAILFFRFNTSTLSWIIGPPALALCSWSMWRFYGFLYSRRQIDLIPAVTG